MTSRKRTRGQAPHTEAPTTIVEPEAPAEPIAAPVESSASTSVERPEPAAAPTFAERVAQKKSGPVVADPFVIQADYQAGVRLFESHRDRQMAIKFDEKPSQAVIDKVKGAGYRWKQEHRIWVHPVVPGSAHVTRYEADQLFDEVSRMVRQEKGHDAGQGVPF